MVSAVFHTPLQASDELKAVRSATPAAAAVPAPAGGSLPPKPTRAPFDGRAVFMAVVPPLAGLGLLIGIWALLTMKGGSFPTPLETFVEAVKLFSDPFYRNGPNDQGIGWNILFSLERVAVGFGMAALVGIPLGFMIGRFDVLNRMVSPLISLLRPVSPLAWLPIGLLLEQGLMLIAKRFSYE